MRRSIVHDFRERLEHSQSLSDEPRWLAFYKRLWPEAIYVIRIDADCKQQRWGIDREILLPSGRRITVDEKKRDRDYGDILLEEWSIGQYQIPNDKTSYLGDKPGWAVDPTKQCDFVAYAIMPSNKCYLLPFELLRQAMMANMARWKTLRINGHPAYPKDALNRSYVTRNLAVTWKELKQGLCQQMLRGFGDELCLPALAGGDNGSSTQLTFEW